MLRAIAAGGMAEVYAVEDPTSGERFALKLLVAVKGALKRFNREYEAMTRLNHPGIVRVYHYGIHEGHPWLTMELLRGTPAQPWVKSFGKPGTPARTAEVLRLGYHLSQALGYIHERGLIHRDLKSANVLVLPDRRVKLVDFGTAHLFDALENLTQEGEFVGTYAYASPEQLEGKGIDARSDLYSLGILLYRLCTGRRPYASNDPAQLVQQHLKGAIPDPRELVAAVPDGLAELVMTLMAKRPDDRVQAAGEVAQTLERTAGQPFGFRSPLAIHDPNVTGRELELRTMRTQMAQHDTCCFLVLGEAGSDRRRVVDTLLRESVDAENPVFIANLQPDRDIEAMLGLLKTVARAGENNQSALRALRKLAQANATQLATPKVRQSLRRSVQQSIRALAGERPVVIGVHGLEHGTSLTLEVLANIRAFAIEAELKLHLLLSCQAERVITDPDISRRFPDATQVELVPLDVRQISLGVGGMLGRRPPPAELSREIFQATDGQPEYVEAAVQQLVETGGLEADDGNRLEWAGAVVDVRVPPAARVDAENLLANIPAMHRRVLEATALLDDEVHVEVIAGALEWDVEAVIWIVDRLAERQVLVWIEQDTRYRWRRGRMGNILRERMSPHRRAAHQEALARSIRPRAPSPAQVRLLLSTGSSPEAFRRCTVAAREAMEAHRYREALGMLGPLFHDERGVDIDLRAEAHLLHARCLQVLRPLDTQAARSLGVARKAMSEHPPSMAEVGFLSSQLSAAIGHYQNYEKHLDAAWTSAEEGAPAGLVAEIALERTDAARLRGSGKESDAWWDRARSAAIRAGNRASMGLVTVASARLRLMMGRPDEAEDIAGKAMQFFERNNDERGYFLAASVWVDTLRRQARWSEATSLLTQKLPEARMAEDPTVYVRMLLSAGWCEIDLGRLGRAQELVDELAATVRKGEALPLQLQARLLHGRILLASGQFINAAFVLKETHERARNASQIVLAEVGRAYWAETVHHLGDPERSAELFQSALLGLRATRARLALTDAITARARVWGPILESAELFKPVQEELAHGAVPTLELEKHLADGEWHRRAGNAEAVSSAYRNAARTLNRVASKLDDTDRAALRVHPWSRHIRRGLT